LDDIDTIDPEDAARAVFSVLEHHIALGEIEDVKATLPTQLLNSGYEALLLDEVTAGKGREVESECFRNRNEVGRLLAKKLTGYADRPDVPLLPLRRGGVSVAYEVGRALGAPLDVFVAHQQGVPGHEESPMGCRYRQRARPQPSSSGTHRGSGSGAWRPLSDSSRCCRRDSGLKRPSADDGGTMRPRNRPMDQPISVLACPPLLPAKKSGYWVSIARGFPVGADLFSFARVEGRAAVAGFDGGKITSDAGALLLVATDRAIRLVERFAGCFTQPRAGADRARSGEAGRTARVRDSAGLRRIWSITTSCLTTQP
jgi:hypothetical protein